MTPTIISSRRAKKEIERIKAHHNDILMSLDEHKKKVEVYKQNKSIEAQNNDQIRKQQELENRKIHMQQESENKKTQMEHEKSLAQETTKQKQVELDQKKHEEEMELRQQEMILNHGKSTNS